jgi:hypothetical protein
VRNSSSADGRYTSLSSSAKKLLEPIIGDPKYRIIHSILTNWRSIVDEKYRNYCAFERITVDRSGQFGTIHLISYNSSASFYLSSSGQYLLDKINSVLGRELVVKILVKEIPTAIKLNPGDGRQRVRGIQNTPKGNATPASDNLLRDSLEELEKCFRASAESSSPIN